MKQQQEYTMSYMLDRTFRKYGGRDALAFVGEKPLTYNGLEARMRSLQAFLQGLGIQHGDKVAILSSNQPNWGVSYFALADMGAVAVPLLPDFSAEEVETIIAHSDSKAILVSANLRAKVKSLATGSLKHIISIEDFQFIKSSAQVEWDETKQPEKTYEVQPDDLVSIIYTSGTTGKSKGVMLTHKNVLFNAHKSREVQHIIPSDRYLSILPMSHTYENTLGLILPALSGAAVYYMKRPPTASVLLPAMRKVKPTIMLSVPLIIEKIYRNKILPQIYSKWATRNLYKVPAIRKKLNKVAGKKLYKMFGGELKFFGIGGAKLDPTVERFLREAAFPYAIGYGLTETSPLIAGANPRQTKLGSTGPQITDIEMKIHQPDPQTGEGEVWVRGASVMKGYYKAPLLTQEVLTEDGWFRTGDLGVLDQEKRLYIRGRLKNVIIGSSGENIYPEEIEAVINNFRYVVESLVIEQKGKLVALVHFNKEELESQYAHMRNEISNYVERKMDELQNELHDYVNNRVNKFSRLQDIILQSDPFYKTPTHKIKRFKYTQVINKQRDL